MYLDKQSHYLEAFQLVWYFYSLAQIDVFNERDVTLLPHLNMLYYNNSQLIKLILVL